VGGKKYGILKKLRILGILKKLEELGSSRSSRSLGRLSNHEAPSDG
jgi:hypothetical protein